MQDCIRSLSVDSPLDTTPLYSVTEASKILQLSAHTLRYYDNLGLFPFLERPAGGKRMFSEADLQWIRLVECLRSSGLPVAKVKYYVELCVQGDNTLRTRLDILKNQEAVIRTQIEDMKKSLKLLQFKINYYQESLAQTGQSQEEIL